MPENTAEIKIREAFDGKALRLPVDQSYKIVLRRMQGYVLEAEDIHFHPNSAVLLPDGADASGAGPMDGIALLETCLMYASDYPARKLLVVGHADATDSVDADLELAQLRADNVLCAVMGDRDGWCQSAAARHDVTDYQRILIWVHAVLGWPCHPGSVDGLLGERTRAAVEGFQAAYNRVYGCSLTIDGIVGEETWGAFFDIYTEEVERRLKITSRALTEARSNLVFVDDHKRAVGCAGHHPVQSVQRTFYRSKRNRRVELLFFDPGEEPQLSCHPQVGECVPGKCEIFNDRIYDVRPIEVKIEPFDFLVRLLPDPRLLDRTFDLVLQAEGGKLVGRFTLIEDCEDCVEYVEAKFACIDPHSRYSLFLQSRGEGTSETVFADIWGGSLRARTWGPAWQPEDAGDDPPPEDDPSVVDDGDDDLSAILGF